MIISSGCGSVDIFVHLLLLDGDGDVVVADVEGGEHEAVSFHRTEVEGHLLDWVAFEAQETG